jgi:hypothetical protein
VLNRVLDLLAQQRWFDTRTPYEHTIHLTRGACLWMLLSRRGVCDTYVKFTERMSLREEAARYAAASRSYPSLVPSFVGHATDGALEILVCRAIDYRAVERRWLLDAGARDRPIGDLVAYFEAMPGARAHGHGAPNTQLLSAIADYHAGRALNPLARRWLDDEAAERVAALTPMPQHGDLVLNNIGRTDADRLVLFDWEDFGAVSLPGLDLFTLELSLAGQPSQLRASRSRRSAGMRRLVDDACAAMQLARADYEVLTPIYALAFRYLKRNYGDDVRERLDQVLRDLDATSPQPAIP